MHGARICPRCRERVDERRARGTLYCLSCGAPLGTPPPLSTGKPKGSSAGIWIALAVGLVLLLGLGGAGVAVWLASQEEEPPAKKKVQGGDAPPLETAQPQPSVKPKLPKR